MDELLLPVDRRIQFSKNQSHVVLPDNTMAQTIREQQGFRRHYLINKAVEEGMSYHTIPMLWKLPFFRQVEELDFMAMASKLGSEYRPKMGSGIALTYFTLIKSMICTGILFVPNGFKLGGWLFSCLCFFAISIIYTVSILWLGQARDKYGGTYSDLVYEAVGSVGFYLSKASILLTQLGFFVVTCVFFNSNLQNIMRYFGVELSLEVCNVIQICMLSPLILLKKITDLSFTHLFGDLIVLLCLGYIVMVDIQILNEDGLGDGLLAFNPDTFLMLIGMTLYSFEGVALIVPIKQAMHNPEKFWIPALMMMVTVSAMLIGFGCLNNLTFGTETKQIITLNLPQNAASTILIILFLVSVILTEPMMLYPPLTMIDTWFGERPNFLLTSVARLVVVTSLSIAAVLLNDKADRYISILGGLLCGPLAYIFPALINLKTKDNISCFEKLLSFFFIVFGVSASVLCTFNSIQNW